MPSSEVVAASFVPSSLMAIAVQSLPQQGFTDLFVQDIPGAPVPPESPVQMKPSFSTTASFVPSLLIAIESKLLPKGLTTPRCKL